MTTNVQDWAYKGRGSVMMGLASGGPIVAVGNTSDLKISIENQTEELEDFQSPSGGTAAMATWVKKASVSMNIHNISPENLARAYLGSTETVASASVTSEVHVAHKDAHVILEHIKPSAVTVKSADGATTYTVDTDYTLTDTGLYIPPGSDITNAASIKVDYSHIKEAVVEALVQTAKEYVVVFSGVNTAQDGRLRIVRLFKVRFHPASETALLTGNFAGINLTGVLIKDTSQPDGKSPYFREILEAAA
ncbi:MAG: hypothetical protein HQL73_07295 [Magnetococcales bacterium]|nr:hypothetical protein [Magnetococcales bacterium]